ncbi:MAG TPA: UbiA family prenyltransferase [bacterium]|nr:UbiA family prenyltransferase [bacterium]
MAWINYLQLARCPISLLLPSFAVGTSYLIAKEGRYEVEIFIPLSAAILGTAGMCALNDYFDVDADRSGAARRPLPFGRISLRTGLAFAITLTILGMMAASLSTQRLVPITGGLAVLLGLLYYWRAKGCGWLGALNFGLIMAAVTFLGIAQAVPVPFLAPYLLFLLFVVLAAAGNQATACFFDYRSDRDNGYCTPSVISGLKRAAAVTVSSRLISFIILLLFLAQRGWFIWRLAPPLVVLGLIPLLSYRLLAQAEKGRHAMIAFRMAMLYTVLSFATLIMALFRQHIA